MPRVLAVHAHPDDETLFSGLLLAKAARLGAPVTVLTCTMGEEGEVIGQKYQNLVDPGQNPAGVGMLGGYRISELREALRVLGVEQGPEFLGGVGAWRDSGMAGSESIAREGAFAKESAGFDEQVEQLIKVMAEHRPEIVVTYGPDGGYGHPDHVRAHRITHAAVERMHSEGHEAAPSQILWCVTERERVDEGLRAAEHLGAPEGWRWPKGGDIAAVGSEDVDFVVYGNEQDVQAKQAAMRAHATQVWVADGSTSDVNPDAREGDPHAPVLFALSNLIAQPLLATESYTVGFTADGVEETLAESVFK